MIAGLSMTCPAIEGASAACRVAAALHTDVLLLHALPGGSAQTSQEVSAGSCADKGTRDIERVVETLQSSNAVSARLVTSAGEVADVIARAVRPHPHAIVVVGRALRTHDYGPPCSVARRTLSLTGVPVLLHTSA
jgi:hypothetical protein